MKHNKKAVFLTQGATVAALYAVLTLVMWQFSSLQIQVRLSEALCVLPLFTNAAVPGLYIGCVIANLLAGNVIDAVFGALATLLASVSTYCIGKKLKGAARLILAPLPAVVFNVIAVPLVLYYGYGFTTFEMGSSVISGFWPVLGLTALSVFIGQMIACYGVGIPLYKALKHILALGEKK